MTELQRIQPRSTYDKMLNTSLLYSLLSCQFSTTIYPQRTSVIGFGIGRIAIASEHIVGGDMNKRNRNLSAYGRQMGYSRVVDAFSHSRIVFSFVYIGVSGAIHYQSDVILVYKRAYLVYLGNIENVCIGEKIACFAVGVSSYFRA